MKNRKMKIKTKTNSTFAKYGLDVANNMLEAPICNCGCNGYMDVILPTDDEICGFMYSVLEEYECERCGIFAHKLNNEVLMAIKMDGSIVCYKAAGESVDAKTARDAVAAMQEDLRLHCYGLLKQVDEKSFKIIMY